MRLNYDAQPVSRAGCLTQKKALDSLILERTRAHTYDDAARGRISRLIPDSRVRVRPRRVLFCRNLLKAGAHSVTGSAVGLFLPAQNIIPRI